MYNTVCFFRDIYALVQFYEVFSNILYGSRCNQLPLIEKLPQWLSGPSSSLSVTAGPPKGYQTGFKRCSDAQCFYSTISIDDINAQSGWSLKTEKIRLNDMYAMILLTQYGIYFWHELVIYMILCVMWGWFDGKNCNYNWGEMIRWLFMMMNIE